MSGWWVTQTLEASKVYFLATVVWVIGSIVLHELAHGWMAIRCGDRTPIETGHMTLNPVVHMGGFGLLMFAVAGFAFGVMPVDPRRFRGPNDDAKVAFAGPAMNFLLAAITLVSYVLWIGLADGWASDVLYANVQIFLYRGLQLNIVLGIFNLLPVPPLDGATVLGRFSRGYRELFMSPQAQNMTMMLFLVIFFYMGAKIWRLADDIAFSLSRSLTRMLF